MLLYPESRFLCLFSALHRFFVSVAHRKKVKITLVLKLLYYFMHLLPDIDRMRVRVTPSHRNERKSSKEQWETKRNATTVLLKVCRLLSFDSVQLSSVFVLLISTIAKRLLICVYVICTLLSFDHYVVVAIVIAAAVVGVHLADFAHTWWQIIRIFLV